MSISSLAEDSALRLARPAPERRAAVETAARVAAEAVANQESVGDAQRKGVDAATAADPLNPPAVQAAALTQLVSFVPTETILLYVAGETAFGEVVVPGGGQVCAANFHSRWAWLLGVAALTALLCLGLSYRKQKEINGEARFKAPILEVGASTAAFAVWALALASTPMRGICGYDYTAWSPVLLLGGTIIIASLLYVFRQSVNWQKVLTDS